MTFFDRAKTIPQDVVDKLEGRPPGFSKVFKFNPYHDENGRFSSGDGAKSVTYDSNAKAMARDKEKAHALSLQVADLAKKTEAALSPILKGVVQAPAHFVHWEFRLKAQESIARKIYQDAKDKKITLEQQAHHLGDSVRYSIATSPKNYKQVLNDTLKKLEAAGYSVIPGKFKNTWAKEGGSIPFYQGVNLNMMAPTGQRWELQFHTNQSYKVKEYQNHPYYEEYRHFPLDDRKLSPAQLSRKQSLFRIMQENQAKVVRPPGASGITWPPIH